MSVRGLLHAWTYGGMIYGLLTLTANYDSRSFMTFHVLCYLALSRTRSSLQCLARACNITAYSVSSFDFELKKISIVPSSDSGFVSEYACGVVILCLHSCLVMVRVPVSTRVFAHFSCSLSHRMGMTPGSGFSARSTPHDASHCRGIDWHRPLASFQVALS